MPDAVVAGELPGVAAARGVEELLFLLVVVTADVLEAFAFGVTVAAQLVEQVAEFVFVDVVFVFRGRQVREVQHCAELHVVRVLVVGVFVRVVFRVLVAVVDAVARVLHVEEAFVRVAVVQRADQAETVAVLTVELTVDREIELLIPQRTAALDAPVFAEAVFGNPIHLFGVAVVHAVGYAAAQLAARTAETESVGSAAGIVFEIVEIRHVIESGRVGELDRILFGQDFRADQHETAREVARNFRRRGFDDHHVVELAAGQDVERKRTGVGFGTRNGSAVDPDVVVALREAPYHDELVVENRNTRNAAYYFCRVSVLRFGDRLGRSAAGHQ